MLTGISKDLSNPGTIAGIKRNDTPGYRLEPLQASLQGEVFVFHSLSLRERARVRGS
jgi:hypothetical protein